MALPQVGAQAVLILTQFEKQVKRYQQLTKKIDKATKSLGAGAKDLVGVGGKVGDVFGKVGSAIANAFGIKSMKGLSTFSGSLTNVLGGALKFAIGGIGSLVAATGGLAVAFTVASAALAVAVKVALAAINRYREFVFEVRRVALEMGVTEQEATKQIAVMEGLGVSVASVSRAYANLGKQIGDEQLRMVEGTEQSTKFTRALEDLGVSLVDQEGMWRSIGEVQDEVNEKLRAVEDTHTRTTLAVAIYGRGYRDVLPILNANQEAVEELTGWMEQYGFTITSEAVPAMEEFGLHQQKLEAIMNTFTALLAEAAIPFVDIFTRKIGDLAIMARNALVNVTALARAFAALVGGAEVAEAMQIALDTMEEFEPATIAAADAQKQLTMETAAQVEALRRQEDAYRNLLEKAIKLQETTTERRLDIERRFTEQWEDIIRDRERQIIDATIKNAQKLFDIELKFARKRQDLIDDWNDNRRDKEEEWARRLAEFDAEAALKRRQLLRRHLERMQSIRLSFQDTAEEAARSNDAVAFLKAQRRRDRELRDERRRYALARIELEEWLKLRRDKLLAAIDAEKELDERSLEDALARLERQRLRALEDLERAILRESEARQRGWAREEEDLEIARQRQFDAEGRWFIRELNQLRLHLQDRLAMWQWYLNQLPADVLPPVGGLPPAPYRLPPNLGINLNQPSGRARRRQEGGMDVVSSPTHMIVGEGRTPEVILTTPVSRSQLHHSFDPFNVNVGGVSRQSETDMIPIVMQLLTQVVRQMR